MANNKQRLSFFAEMRRNNNPRFYNTMSTDDLRRSVKRIVIDLKYNNIAEEDYVYFDNNTLFNICIDESERQYKNASVLLNAMNYYINCGLRAGYVPNPTIEYVEEYRNAVNEQKRLSILANYWKFIHATFISAGYKVGQDKVMALKMIQGLNISHPSELG